MILKKLNHRQGKESGARYDEWEYFDNIVNARNYYDDGIKGVVVECVFRDGNRCKFVITDVAYLMSDNGKTVEKISSRCPEVEDSTETVHKPSKSLEELGWRMEFA